MAEHAGRTLERDRLLAALHGHYSAAIAGLIARSMLVDYAALVRFGREYAAMREDFEAALIVAAWEPSLS